MNRLTKRINGVVTYIGEENSYDTGQIATELNVAARREILERLADYEDTGVPPKSYVELRKVEEGLNAGGFSVFRMAELMRADKDGRLVVRPYKVGGTVHVLLQDSIKYYPDTNGWYISEERVGAIAEGGFYLGNPADNIYVRNEEIGKEVFLTHEEAKRALGETDSRVAPLLGMTGEETGDADSRVAALLGMTEKKEAKERMVCPHCGGRAHHTVGGKEFCSLCLEEMRRE